MAKKIIKNSIKNPIKNTRITEKGSLKAETNVYTFNVASNANKTELKKAIFAQYKVRPLRINISAVPQKRVSYKNRPGVVGGGKKAFVYLKKGDKIEFI